MEITKEEFIKKYGKVILTFSSYYKYTFTYSAKLGGERTITASIGGNSDEIYRIDVANNEQVKLKDLDPYSAYVYENGKEVYGFYDY